MIVGTIGLLLLILGWIPQTLEVIKSRKSGLRVEFSLLYAAGSILLALHAYSIGDRVFLALNTVAFVMSATTLFYKIKYK